MYLYKDLVNKKGVLAGIDEAGRGAWAGPVVAAAVVLRPSDFSQGVIDQLKKVNDSKLLSPAVREKLFSLITKRLIWSVGRSSVKEIDKYGIGRAVKLAMQRAVEKLPLTPAMLLIDYYSGIGLPIPTRGVLKGDQKVFCIAAASIVAKVYRDRLMVKYHSRFSQWGFDRHKGYGTAAHRLALKQRGVSQIHRLSFSPIKEFCISE